MSSGDRHRRGAAPPLPLTYRCMELRLSDKTALVTGSHRGTGAIIASRLIDEGATVLVHGFTRDEAELIQPRPLPSLAAGDP